MTDIRRVVFMGTADFAVPSLRALAGAYEVVGVFCQPDRPKGRSGAPAMCPVKEVALELGLPVLQFERMRGKAGREALEALAPDLCVTAAFGQILSQRNLDVPKYGTVNVHASLLPRYRGAAPIQWAIIEGEEETGITTMFTDAGVDTGDILLQRTTPIGADETGGQLFDRLAVLGAQVLMETLEGLVNGTVVRTPQDHHRATTVRMLTKEDGLIDFSQPSKAVVDRARGVFPWPGAYCFMDGVQVKLFDIEAIEADAPGMPGDVLDMSGIAVKTGDGAVSIGGLQTPGKRRVTTEAYLMGHKRPERLGLDG